MMVLAGPRMPFVVLELSPVDLLKAFLTWLILPVDCEVVHSGNLNGIFIARMDLYISGKVKNGSILDTKTSVHVLERHRNPVWDVVELLLILDIAKGILNCSELFFGLSDSKELVVWYPLW